MESVNAFFSKLINFKINQNTMNLIKRITDKLRRKPLLVKPVVSCRLKIGDYVFVSRWSDGDPNDPWYVSTLKEIIIDSRGTYFKVDGSEMWWKHIKTITKEEGEEILRTYPKLESLNCN
jgi:hypothetical protein